jgi:hypothetical protein
MTPSAARIIATATCSFAAGIAWALLLRAPSAQAATPLESSVDALAYEVIADLVPTLPRAREVGIDVVAREPWLGPVADQLQGALLARRLPTPAGGLDAPVIVERSDQAQYRVVVRFTYPDTVVAEVVRYDDADEHVKIGWAQVTLSMQEIDPNQEPPAVRSKAVAATPEACEARARRELTRELEEAPEMRWIDDVRQPDRHLDAIADQAAVRTGRQGSQHTCEAFIGTEALALDPPPTCRAGWSPDGALTEALESDPDPATRKRLAGDAYRLLPCATRVLDPLDLADPVRAVGFGFGAPEWLGFAARLDRGYTPRGMPDELAGLWPDRVADPPTVPLPAPVAGELWVDGVRTEQAPAAGPYTVQWVARDTVLWTQLVEPGTLSAAPRWTLNGRLPQRRAATAVAVVGGTLALLGATGTAAVKVHDAAYSGNWDDHQPWFLTATAASGAGLVTLGAGLAVRFAPVPTLGAF